MIEAGASRSMARSCSRSTILPLNESEEAMATKQTTILTITLSEATNLLARTKAEAENGKLLGVIMPNGKRLRDCTGEYLTQLGRAMQELGYRLSVD
jgi:hypothetical protein